MWQLLNLCSKNISCVCDYHLVIHVCMHSRCMYKLVVEANGSSLCIELTAKLPKRRRPKYRDCFWNTLRKKKKINSYF